MAQNNNIVVYALMPAGGAQQAPPAGQTYHLPPFTLIGEFSHRRPDRRNINDHKLTMGVPHHPKNKPLPRIGLLAGCCKRSDVSQGLYIR